MEISLNSVYNSEVGASSCPYPEVYFYDLEDH